MTPYYADDTVTIWHGDALDVLAALPDCSVDAVVTDPPYGLEFMGKEWDSFRVDDPGTNRYRGDRAAAPKMEHDASTAPRDPDKPWQKERSSYTVGQRAKTHRCDQCGKRDQFRNPHGCDGQWVPELVNPNSAPPGSLAFQAWCKLWAAECLRILKPGSHLLAFGGTRTSHRLACAIEDAGFEIRDSIAWLYGQGFPKSLRVSRDERFCHCDATVHTSSRTSPEPETDDHTRTADASDEAVGEGRSARRATSGPQGSLAGYRPVPGSGDVLPHPAAASAPASLQLQECAPTRNRSVVLADDRDGGSSRSLSPAPHSGHPSNLGSVRPSRSPNGEPPRTLASTSPADTSESASHTPGTTLDPSSFYGTGLPLCSTCGKPKADGLGTALKPSFEPVICARKPLVGTVAANVLAYGTGGLNIDATRILPNGQLAPQRLIIGAWEQDQHRCNSCAEDAGSRAKLGTPETKAPTAHEPVRLSTNARADQSQPATSKTVTGCSDGTTARGTSTSSSIAPSGKKLTDPSPMVTSSTTATTTPSTTGLRTCSSCGAAITSPITHANQISTLTDPALRPTTNGSTAAASSGRWPSNVVLDEHQAAALDEMSGEVGANSVGSDPAEYDHRNNVYGEFSKVRPFNHEGGKGGASRFFFVSRGQSDKLETCPSPNNVNAAEPNSNPQNGTGDSAPRAASQGHSTGLSRAEPSTLETPSGSNQSASSDTPPTQLTVSESWPGPQRGRLIPTDNPASDAALLSAPIVTTTTTDNPSSSSGSVDPATSPITSRSKEPGGAALPPDSLGSRFTYTAKASTDERITYTKSGAGDHRSGGNFAGGIRVCNVCQSRTKPGNWIGGDERPWPACGHDDWAWGEPKEKGGVVAHPTVKPLSLMRWLVRLVTPPGGIILEPFAGSGTTVEAAILEGFRCIAIEREADYLPLITQRIHRRRDPIAYLTQGGHDLGLFDDFDGAA